MQIKFCHTLCVHKCEASGETSLLKSTRDSSGADTGREPVVQLALQPSPALKDRIRFSEEWNPDGEKTGTKVSTNCAGVGESRRIQQMSS